MKKLSNNQAEQVLAAIYVRVSTQEQETDTQIQENTKWAEDNNYKVVEIYEDILSGKARKLPNRERMMQDARNGRFKKLIINNTDRLGRSMKETIPAYYELRDCGVYIDIVRRNWKLSNSPDDTMGTMFFTMFTVFAEMESTFIRERTKGGRKTKHKRGVYAIGGKLRWGYYQEPKKSRDDKTDRPILTDQTIKGYYHNIIYPAIVINRYSLGKVAEMLNDKGIKTSKNKPWNHFSLASLLSKKNRGVLTGTIIVEKNIYKLGQTKSGASISNKIGENPKEDWNEIKIADPIFTEEQFDKIREVIDSNIKKGNEPMGDVGLIRSLNMRCGICGDKFKIHLGRKTQKGTRQIYYAPETHVTSKFEIKRKGLKKCTHFTSWVPADSVDKYVWDTFIDRIIYDKNMVDSFLDITSKEKKIETLDKMIADEEKEIGKDDIKLSDLLDLYLDKKIDKNILDKKSADVQEDKDTRVKKVKIYKQQKTDVANALDTAFRYESKREELLQKMFSVKDKLDAVSYSQKRDLLSYVYSDTKFTFLPITLKDAISSTPPDESWQEGQRWWFTREKRVGGVYNIEMDCGVFLAWDGFISEDKLLNMLEILNNIDVALSEQHAGTLQ